MNNHASRYVVAVSGGVDSAVLLDMLVSRSDQLKSRVSNLKPNFELIVAHFDHGVRTDSSEDAKFVESLAKKYNLPFEAERVELGATASEAEAREARYEFLKRVQQKHDAIGIITAHHQDDLLETGVINMLRGTGHRGLYSLRSRDVLLRPLLHVTKKEIYEYAKNNNLQWREDSTNQSVDFLRNRVRLNLIPKSTKEWRNKMHQRLMTASEIGKILDSEIDNLVGRQIKNNQVVLSRRWFIGLPHSISLEVVLAVLRKIGASDIDRELIERIAIQIKTAKPGKKLDIDNQYFVLITKRSARFTNRTTQKTVRV